MTLIEIVLFVGNEVIGRQKLGAVDAGDTIFVHLFGAYFGLAVSRVLHYKNADHHKNQASETSTLFMNGSVNAYKVRWLGRLMSFKNSFIESCVRHWFTRAYQ